MLEFDTSVIAVRTKPVLKLCPTSTSRCLTALHRPVRPLRCVPGGKLQDTSTTCTSRCNTVSVSDVRTFGQQTTWVTNVWAIV